MNGHPNGGFFDDDGHAAAAGDDGAEDVEMGVDLGDLEEVMQGLAQVPEHVEVPQLLQQWLIMRVRYEQMEHKYKEMKHTAENMEMESAVKSAVIASLRQQLAAARGRTSVRSPLELQNQMQQQDVDGDGDLNML